MKGIGRAGTVLVDARIQAPFIGLGLIIDVNFSILEEDAPSLLYNKYILYNGLDISLQGRYSHIGSKRHPLA